MTDLLGSSSMLKEETLIFVNCTNYEKLCITQHDLEEGTELLAAGSLKYIKS